MSLERLTTEGIYPAPVPGGGADGTAQTDNGRIQIATGEAISPLVERERQEAHLMNMLTATILVLGEQADATLVENLVNSADYGNFQGIADLFHSQPDEVRRQIAQKVEHVRAVNHYVALGIIQGYWGGAPFSLAKGVKDGLKSTEDTVHEVRIGLLLNGKADTPFLIPQGNKLAECVAQLESRLTLSDLDRQEIHDLEQELAFRVPNPEEILSVPGKHTKNYLRSLSENNLVLKGAHPHLTHAVALENGKPKIVRVKPAIAKLRRPDGRRRRVTLLRPVDDQGNVIPLE